jgi:hypothetical protein
VITVYQVRSGTAWVIWPLPLPSSGRPPGRRTPGCTCPRPGPPCPRVMRRTSTSRSPRRRAERPQRSR